MFGKLRVWDTEANNGVPIYLLWAERKIEIVADRGLTRHVPQGHWEDIVATIRENFQGGRFETGLMRAIEAVEELLVQRFAAATGSVNPDELPNRPHIT